MHIQNTHKSTGLFGNSKYAQIQNFLPDTFRLTPQNVGHQVLDRKWLLDSPGQKLPNPLATWTAQQLLVRQSQKH